MPIVKKEEDRESVMAAANCLEAALKAAGMRAKVDAGSEKTPGWKFNFWEMKVSTAGKVPYAARRHKNAVVFALRRSSILGDGGLARPCSRVSCC